MITNQSENGRGLEASHEHGNFKIPSFRPPETWVTCLTDFIIFTNDVSLLNRSGLEISPAPPPQFTDVLIGFIYNSQANEDHTNDLP